MKIGVISDTHLNDGQFLPRQVWDTFAGVELILHAGDSVAARVLDDLSRLAPVVAVRGNCDGWDLQNLPEREIAGWRGKRIGLIHGNAGGSRSTSENAFKAFAGERVDAIVFGHSHAPYLEWRDGILMFNPGSPTAKRREPRFSLGLLEIINDRLQAKHIFF